VLDAYSKPASIRISEELTPKMTDRLMVDQDIYRTIETCERTGEAFYDSSTGRFSCHMRIGAITQWVEYTKNDEGVLVVNAYSHRVEIVE
jgi:hypothetical protein